MASDKPPHPGTIEVIDAATQAVVKVMKADEVSAGLAYAQIEGRGYVPVVRIVQQTSPEGVRWRAYDAEGFLLTTGSARA